MRLVQSELEKLALYVDGPLIQIADIELLVGRAREEEFLELSDALQKRDLVAATRYVGDALEQGVHGLPLLGAIASIVRGLLENADRLQRFAGGSLPRSYDAFKSGVFSRIEEEAKANKSKVPHPYAAFLGMQAAAKYGKSALLKALAACAEADLALKSSGDNKLILERLLWTVCGRAPAAPMSYRDLT
jgi:DNA polymerase-3 subunit delta